MLQEKQKDIGDKHNELGNAVEDTALLSRGAGDTVDYSDSSDPDMHC